MAFPYAKVRVRLFNSLAATGHGHGTHRAVVAGLLGMDTLDDRNPRAIELAAADGVVVVMPGEPLPPHGTKVIAFEHVYASSIPDNYLVIDAELENGSPFHLEGESPGGGNIRVAQASADMADLGIDAEARPQPPIDAPVCPITDEEWARFVLLTSRLAALAMTYGPSHPRARRPTLSALRALAEEAKLDAGRFALCLEAWLTEQSPQAAWVWAVARNRTWRREVEEGLALPHKLSFLPGNWASRLLNSPHASICGPLEWRIKVGAIGIQELNGAGGLVTAAPTGGASGTVPATVVGITDHLGLDETNATFGVLVAGLVGFVAFGRGYVSGARGGCGAEIGIAGMMAAAAAAHLLGGGWDELDTAAALASLPWMGTECSPTLGLVEYPCAYRNSQAAVLALHAAIDAFTIRAPYPADRHMDLIFAFGEHLPPEGREREQGDHGQAQLDRCDGCRACTTPTPRE